MTRMDFRLPASARSAQGQTAQHRTIAVADARARPAGTARTLSASSKTSGGRRPSCARSMSSPHGRERGGSPGEPRRDLTPRSGTDCTHATFKKCPLQRPAMGGSVVGVPGPRPLGEPSLGGRSLRHRCPPGRRARARRDASLLWRGSGGDRPLGPLADWHVPGHGVRPGPGAAQPPSMMSPPPASTPSRRGRPDVCRPWRGPARSIHCLSLGPRHQVMANHARRMDDPGRMTQRPLAAVPGGPREGAALLSRSSGRGRPSPAPRHRACVVSPPEAIEGGGRWEREQRWRARRRAAS